jgi:hypothetical protein
MKKLFLLLCVLSFLFGSFYAYATVDTLEGQELTDAANIEGVTTTDTVEGQVLKAAAGGDPYSNAITFESATYSTGDIVGQDSWTETAETSAAYTVATDQYYAGSQAMKYATSGSASNAWVERVFDNSQSGTFTVTFYARHSNKYEGHPPIALCDGTCSTAANRGPYFWFGSSKYIEYNDGTTKTPSDVEYDDSTWELVTLTINLSADTYTVQVALSGPGGNYGFANTLSSIDRIAFNDGENSGRTFWIDNLDGSAS